MSASPRRLGKESRPGTPSKTSGAPEMGPSAHNIARVEQLIRSLSDQNQALRRNLDVIGADVASMQKSWRWKLGSMIVTLAERLLMRRRAPIAMDHINAVLVRTQGLAPCDTELDIQELLSPTTARSSRRGMRIRECLVSTHQEGDLDGSGSFFRKWLDDSLDAAEKSILDIRLAKQRPKIDGLLDRVRLPEGPPLVSIIMPSFNRANVMLEAINSILEQTYPRWELVVCDDGSEDHSAEVAASLDDDRIRVLRLEHAGAASARNSGLRAAQGQVIAYLDTDNIWHPDYLAVMVAGLLQDPGRLCAYCSFFDLIRRKSAWRIRSGKSRPFDYERLKDKNYIDLNGFVHRSELFKVFGGFTDELPRQQDWDLVLKYARLRDPVYVDLGLYFYRRNATWGQLTELQKTTAEFTSEIVRNNQILHDAEGLPDLGTRKFKRVTVVSWDICRNHFSKAYNVAEALSNGGYDVQLVGFKFFDEPIFPPYADAKPPFETLYLPGGDLAALARSFGEVLPKIRGEVIYCVKPRLPSFGLGLLANYHFGIPVILEFNDLETVVSNPDAERKSEYSLDEFDPADPDLKTPYGKQWTNVMEALAKRAPVTTTHNENLNRHFGGGSLYLRNLKDESHFDPQKIDREATRLRFGINPGDRVILFGGMLRRHKGIFELVELLKLLNDDRYKLLFVGSRLTPDQAKLQKAAGDSAIFIEPQDRNAMAAVNAAADAVILWLDPETPASHYQMPYKITDALAMKVPVIANDISDMGALGRQGYLKLVPYGDFEKLASTLNGLFDDEQATQAMTQAGRSLYLRQFSYHAARANFRLAAERVESGAAYGIATRFADLLDQSLRQLK